jgi:DNA-binding transcriptional ArsR family regulator
MSRTRPRVTAKRGGASVFAALGDATRQALVVHLARGQPRSIAELTRGSGLTRQAIRKHLRVLETAGMVRGVRLGREHRFAFSPQPIVGIREYLDFVSQQWEQALGRLKSFVEK